MTVSICLPNLNNRMYLDERLQSIYDQTLTDWELIIVDNYSDDGAWELLQSHAVKDSRIHLTQAPREGMYANWNNTLQLAKGEFVYIATSDDNMATDCLEKLVFALETYPDCDLAVCDLMAFGVGAELMNEWWSERSPFMLSARVIGQGVRQCPLDGLLHLTGESVYVSITQLLIRRSLFEHTGLFPTEWGSAGDIFWDIQAGFLANSIFVPDTWGGWRLHADQATQLHEIRNSEHIEKMNRLRSSAIETLLRYPKIKPYEKKLQNLISYLDSEKKTILNKWMLLVYCPPLIVAQLRAKIFRSRLGLFEVLLLCARHWQKKQ